MGSCLRDAPDAVPTGFAKKQARIAEETAVNVVFSQAFLHLNL